MTPCLHVVQGQLLERRVILQKIVCPSQLQHPSELLLELSSRKEFKHQHTDETEFGHQHFTFHLDQMLHSILKWELISLNYNSDVTNNK